MKQSTFSAVMANSIKNLLQGYTKGIRFVAVLMVLLTMGIGQAWAYVNGSAYVYFDPNDKWNYTNYYFASIQETGSWQTKTYKLSNIANTKLYYLSTTEHNDAGYISFGGQNGTFDGGYWGYDSFKSYITMCGEKCSWGLNYQNTYLFYPSANTKGTSLNPQYLGGGYNDLNSQQTIKSAVNGADANSKATISITSYKMTGNGQVTQQTATLGTGAKDSYVTAARTAKTTLELGTVATGYQFDGWYAVKTGGTALSTSTTYTYYPTAATTVYARFSAKKYTVTLNKQSGTGGTASVTATYGQAMPSATMPTRTGYTFNGYFDATSAGTQYYKADGTSARTWNKTSNTTLYAQWIGKTYTVTLDNQGATTEGATSVTATYNAAMPSIANNLPKKTGYTFNGYFDATSGGTKYYDEYGTSAKNWDKTDATTLYAQWTLKTYTVKWVVDGVELTGAQLDGVTTIVNHGDKITTAPKVVVEDYCGDIFVGWTDAEGGEYEHGTSNLYTTDFLQITNDTTLYAVFADYKK